MSEEIVKAYKSYNPGGKLRCILFVMGIFIAFVFVGIMKLVNQTEIARRVTYIVAVIMLPNISIGGYKYWIRNNSGYGKFLRSINNSYRRLKIMMIISAIEGLVFDLIYITILKLTFMVLKIEKFFTIYEIFYGIVLGFFMLGMDQILSYYFKVGTKGDVVSAMIIWGIIGGGVPVLFEDEKFLAVMSSANIIIIISIVLVIYLSIIYANVFKIIKNRWWAQ